jgi:hypothetical protein
MVGTASMEMAAGPRLFIAFDPRTTVFANRLQSAIGANHPRYQSL